MSKTVSIKAQCWICDYNDQSKVESGHVKETSTHKQSVNLCCFHVALRSAPKLFRIHGWYLLASVKENWWRLNMQIMPLVAFTGLNLPSILFDIIWGDFGRWITFILVTLQLFFQKYFVDFCGFPVALLFLTVTIPHMLAICLRNNIVGAISSVVIGSYLLDGHIRSREPSQTFAKKCCCVNTLAIALLLISPLLEVYQFIIEV